jgi:hypothetical protein
MHIRCKGCPAVDFCNSSNSSRIVVIVAMPPATILMGMLIALSERPNMSPSPFDLDTLVKNTQPDILDVLKEQMCQYEAANKELALV